MVVQSLLQSNNSSNVNVEKEKVDNAAEVEVISSQPLVQQNKGESITTISQEFSINSNKEKGSVNG
jgi:hypothetical protein